MSHLAASTIKFPRPLAALLAAGLASLLLASAAQANPVFEYQLGSGTGGAAGQIEYPWGVAVNPTSGNVYVADGFTNERVDEYSSTGAFTRAWGWDVVDNSNHFEICTTKCQGGSYVYGGGGFNGIRAITVDTTSGNVYAVDGNDRVSEFSSTGTFIQAFGMGVSDGNPGVLETCSTNCTYGRGGVLDSPTGIAFDPTSGNLYVVSSSQEAVSEFTPSGGFVKEYGWGVADGANHFETCTTVSSCQAGSAGAGAGQLASPQGIAVDPHSGDVYVADAGNNRIDEFSAGGTFMKAYGWGVLDGASKSEICTTTCQAGLSGGGAGEVPTPFAVAVDEAGDVYAAEYSEFSGLGNRVDEFDSSGKFMLTFGWRVSSDNQLKFEVCRTDCQGGLSPSGPVEGNGEFFEAGGLGFDGAHGLYVADLWPAVQKFNVSAQKPPSCSLASTGKVTLSTDGRGTLPVQVQCNQRATAKLKGTLTDKPVGATAKHFIVSGVSSAVHANVKKMLTLTLPGAAMRDLKHGATEHLVMHLTASNANGTGLAGLKVLLHL